MLVKVEPLWQSDPIRYLVRARFPSVPTEAALVEPAKPMSPGLRAAMEAAKAYRAELLALEETALEDLVQKQRDADRKKARAEAERREAALPFNQPKAEADFAHWASASFWTLDEATALSFGKDPRVASWKAVSPHVNNSPFAKAFEARRDLVHRAGVMGQLAQRTPPSEVIAWAERMRIPIPPKLVETVEALGIQVADWKALFERQKEFTEQAQSQMAEEHAAHMAAVQNHSDSIAEMQAGQNKLIDGYKELLSKKDGLIAAMDERIEHLTNRIAELAELAAKAEKPLGAKERDSLLKLVIAMAIDGYGYDPKAARSPIAKELANHLAGVGLPLDEDTVRKYLAEGKELLPGDETEQRG